MQIHNLKNSHLAREHLSQRRARTRSLIQLGGLMEAVGLVNDLGIILGKDLQKDLSQKDQVATLTGALLMLKDMINASEFHPILLKDRGASFLSYRNLHNKNTDDKIVDDHCFDDPHQTDAPNNGEQ